MDQATPDSPFTPERPFIAPEFLEPEGELTAELLHNLLGLIMPEAPHVEVIEHWTVFERLLVYDYAAREHLAAAGNEIDRRPRPSFVLGNVLLQRLIALDNEWKGTIRALTPQAHAILRTMEALLTAFQRMPRAR
jgi:hypothetical protein